MEYRNIWIRKNSVFRHVLHSAFQKNDWKKIEKNNVTIALNVFVKKEKTYPVYISKYNPNHEKQVIAFIIPNGRKMALSSIKKTINDNKSKRNSIKD